MHACAYPGFRIQHRRWETGLSVLGDLVQTLEDVGIDQIGLDRYRYNLRCSRTSGIPSTAKILSAPCKSLNRGPTTATTYRNPLSSSTFLTDEDNILRRRVEKACSGTWRMEKEPKDVAIMSEQAINDSAKRKTHIQWRQKMLCRLDLAKLVHFLTHTYYIPWSYHSGS